MVNNGFCCLYAYFAVMQRNTAKTSDYVKAIYEITFLLLLFIQVWRVDSSCSPMLQLCLSWPWHIFLSYPQYKREAQWGLQSIFCGMESCCHSPGSEKSGFSKWETLFCLLIYSWGQSLVSMKTEHNALLFTGYWQMDIHKS